MVVLTVTLLWLLTDDAFRVTANNITLEGVNHADEDAVRDQLDGIDREPNVFRVRAAEFVRDMRLLPEVSSAAAVVTVPANVSVLIQEREPVFTWSDGGQTWLVDRLGVLFARATKASRSDVPEAGSNEPPVEPDAEVDQAQPNDEAGADVATESESLPVVVDHRLVKEPLEVGSNLPDIDLAVMQQLLALTPQLLGSASASLELSIDEVDGYVLRSDLGWQAVFGHYSPSLQSPEAVPSQVQCLTWLLASRERRLERVRLAASPEGCGTFTRSGGRN